MTLADFLDTTRSRYSNCLTKSYQEGKCRLFLGSFNADSLFTIHGTKYQRCRRASGKLADRTIISAEQDGFVCVVELKGGKIPSVSDVVTQVQRGLDLAENILNGRPVQGWFPVVLHGRRLASTQVREFSLSRNKVRFRNELPRRVQFKRCDTTLDDLLS